MSDAELVEKLIKWQTENYHSVADLCRILEISRNTFINWKLGKPLSAKTRKKIVEAISSKPSTRSEVEEVSAPIKTYPVISEVAAATINTIYFTAYDYAHEYAEDFVSFSMGQPGDFVLKVSGDSMEPWYPAGTLLLVRPNVSLQNGDRVIAVLADGSTLFKMFAEDQDSFYLMSENENDGKDFKFNKKNYGGVRALYLVVQSMRSERALDSARRQHGIPDSWITRMKRMS